MSQFYLNLEQDYDERYDFAKFLNYESEEFDPLTSLFLSELRKLPIAGRLAVGSFENRIDLISFQVYRSTQYWWMLLEYNDLVDPINIPSNLVIEYPSLSDIESIYFRLKSLEVAKS